MGACYAVGGVGASVEEIWHHGGRIGPLAGFGIMAGIGVACVVLGLVRSADKL